MTELKQLVPAFCPECGSHDYDVCVLAWVSFSDGISNDIITDTYVEVPTKASAYCPKCAHDWTLSC